VGAQGRRSRSAESRASGQHLLRSDRIAHELVAQAGIRSHDVVLEVGAGRGRLTDALTGAAGRVVAVEVDPGFAERLRTKFRGRPDVTIVEGDILRIALPIVPFRTFGNIPFGLTSAILRRLLDDPTSPLVGADLIVQYEAARKRASVWPSNLASLGWLPWWEFRLTHRLPASAFEPVPSVDAALLSIGRRRAPLLSPARRRDFLEIVRQAFGQAGLPIQRSLRSRLPARAWKRTARERGIRPGATPSDLDVFDWIALFELVHHSADRGGKASGPRR
jgi:23S rRNA (adenine-N6)-dimethyltransferase